MAWLPYDANGNRIYTVDGLNHTNTAIYDALNRMVTNQFQDGSFQATRYDSAGRKIAQTDQATNTTWFGYDGAGRLTSVTNALMQVTRYAYDEAGNQTNQVDALNHTTTYFYDALGRRVQRVLPGGQSETFGYDAAGNAVCQTNFNGVIITNQYDTMNRLVSRTATNGYAVSYAYTATGQRAAMTDPSGGTVYQYDNRDRLTNKTVSWNGGPSVGLGYAYDARGGLTNLQSGTSGGLKVAYGYDALGRLDQVLHAGVPAANYTYDGVGNLHTLACGSLFTNTYQYDALNRLTNLASTNGGGSLASFYYQLGVTGNRTNLNERVNGTSRTCQWQYDQLYRLTNESIGSLGAAGYAFDAVGNRTNRTSTVSGLTNQAPTYGTNDWLTDDGYDGSGNTTNSAGTSYQYDVLNRLTSANNGAIVITYDGDGNRACKTVGGVTTYCLVDDRNPTGYAQVVEEYQGAGLYRVYDYGLSLVSQRTASATNFFVLDGHGSTRALLNPDGTVAETYAYDAYGNRIAGPTTPATLYLYCGEQWDPDLGQYYLRARYYKPDTGRFWTMDALQGNQETPLSLHKYLYCQANPVSGSDPSGYVSLQDAAKYGRLIHSKLGEDFMEDPRIEPFGISGKSVVTSLNRYGINVDTITAFFPDLVDINPANKEVYEIKPIGVGVAAGFLQLEVYLKLFNYFDPVKNWKPGSTYVPPVEVTLDPLTYAIVSPPVDGVILYKLFSVKDNLKRKIIQAEVSENADVEDSVGIATLDSALGAF